MQEILITLQEVADMMSTSKSKAKDALTRHGVFCIDMGRGRGGGLRWLLSSVVAVMQTMSKEVQGRKGGNSKKIQTPLLNLSSMSVDEIYASTFDGTPLAWEALL